MKLVLASIAAFFMPQIKELIPSGKVGFIPNASDLNENPHWVEEDRQKLIENGYEVINVDLREGCEELKKVEIIFVAGGNTFYLLEKMHESGAFELIKELVKKGIVYVGSSAGACVAGTSIKPIKELDDITKADLNSYEGMKLVNSVILPHIDNEKFKESSEKAKKLYSHQFKITELKDSQAVLVNDGKEYIIEYNKQKLL